MFESDNSRHIAIGGAIYGSRKNTHKTLRVDLSKASLFFVVSNIYV